MLKFKTVIYLIFNIFRNFPLLGDFVICVDIYGLIFGSTVSLICCRVLNFSKSYISGEIFKVRFTFILLMFVCSIILLIFSGNLIFLIIGWDGLGVISYLLVIFFFSRKSSNAGMLTILRNRIGDIFLILRIRLFIGVGRWNWGLWRKIEFSVVIRLLVSIGAFTKRAQIPFSAWLPAAIAAPTPVSSLVHSSTLVTAGIYVIFRFRGVLIFKGVEIFGILTLLIAGLNALKEIDIKKIVALSTLRQLGLIVCSLGAGFFRLSFFHLILHAFFKALLFIRVGNMIHYSDDYQDLRKINFFENFSSITLTFCVLANLSLIGFPFLRGFFSKDLILENFFLNNYFILSYWVLFWVGCVLTSIYRRRFLFRVIFGNHKSKRFLWKFLEDKNFLLGGTLLWIFGIFSGSRVFWVLNDFRERVNFSYRFKLLINGILLIGIIRWFFMAQWTKFFNGKSWRIFQMWRLSGIRQKLGKNTFLLSYNYLNFKRDQFFNKEAVVLGESFVGEIKIFVFKKYFYNWKFFILFLILFII